MSSSYESNQIQMLIGQIEQRDAEIEKLRSIIAHHEMRSNMEATFQATEKQKDQSMTSDDVIIIDQLLQCQDDSLKQFEEDHEQWTSLFGNQYNTYRLKDETKAMKYWNSRAAVVEFMFAWFIHIKSQHKKPLQLVRLSVVLFHYGCPQPIWRILHKLKLCLSYEKTRLFMETAGKVPVGEKLKWIREPSISIFGADNCAYYNHQNFIRDGKPTHFLSTINWYERFISETLKHHMKPEDEMFTNNFSANKPTLM